MHQLHLCQRDQLHPGSYCGCTFQTTLAMAEWERLNLFHGQMTMKGKTMIQSSSGLRMTLVLAFMSQMNASGDLRKWH